MSRLKHTMSLEEMVHAISNGTPGTIAVLAGIMADHKKVDPENAMDIFGYLFTMDMFHIYDGNLWNIHSRLCEMEIVKTIAILRGLQLGLISPEEIKHFASSKVLKIDFFILISQIRGILGNFAEGYEM